MSATCLLPPPATWTGTVPDTGAEARTPGAPDTRSDAAPARTGTVVGDCPAMRDGRGSPGRWEDDAALAAALRRGDEGAFAWLLATYHRPLRAVALGFVGGNGTLADEVVAETWLAVVAGIDRFEGRSSVKTWLFRILTNRARTRGERERRTVPFSALADGEARADDPTFDPDRFLGRGHPTWPGHWSRPPRSWEGEPEERLDSAETLAVLERAVATLPPAQRSVLVLRDVQGVGPAETAALLGLSDGNQRVLLHRARAKVRRALASHLLDDGADR